MTETPKYHELINEHDQTWQAIADWSEKELMMLYSQLGSPQLGFDMTNFIRGRIAQLNLLRTLTKPPPEPTQPQK